jgi:peroxiredoxin/predicted 2-oxoglutarate/Fe(II)-dependent dioxygenase YbiX
VLDEHVGHSMTVKAPAKSVYANLTPGDPCPWVRQRSGLLPSLNVDFFAGRYIVLCFFGSAADPRGRRAIDAMLRHRDRFDDHRASFFGISIDPADESEGRVKDISPGVHFLWDFDGAVSRQYGALPREQPENATEPIPYRLFWLVVDPSLHVLGSFPISNADGSDETVFTVLDSLPDPENFGGFEVPAPVLFLPNVFEPGLCEKLISLYDTEGGNESGVMRNDTGVIDSAMKRRKDYIINDQEIIRGIQIRLMRRVAPEIEKLFFMKITRMERYIVGCYAAEDGGHFRAHRDNGPGATAHRRFAVSINLNADFDGGEICFPEYNPRGYKAPPGWAVVFPCAILHKVLKVTRGRRYAFLPFVYDEGGARIRSANRQATRAGT